MLLRRTLVVWLVIIAAETVHGIVRELFLTPVIGGLRARQIGVAGLAVMLLSPWIAARLRR